MQGRPQALIVLVVFAGLLFALAVNVLATRFAAATLAATGAPTGGERARSADRDTSFRAGLGRNLRRKEWRLLARDPSLFAQLGLQIVYTIPIAVVLLRSEALPTALALAPTIVVIAAQVSASLSWIMVSGEDAPELMATAPVSVADVDHIKLSAVGLPVLVIIALPLAGLALISWQVALLTALFAAVGATSTALLNFWHPMPGNRRGMLRRHSQSKLIALIEHALAISWAIAIVLALAGSLIALLPAALVVAILGYFRRRHRRDATSVTSTSAQQPLADTPVRA
jgi:ABC-2 type transport system permease protein